MTFKFLALTFWGAYGLTGLLAASDVPGRQLKLQGNVNLDPIAEQTHGVLKWRNGAFLYMDEASVPIFYTLDREGRLLSSATLEIPGASQVWGYHFDRGADGSVVFAGGVYSAYGQAAPLIAWISPDGHTERVIRTAPYFPHMISIAPDGTVWTVGCEMIDHKPDAPGLDPQAGVLRHFDRTGKLIGSFFPQSQYLGPHQTVWLTSGHIVATNDRIGWYAPGWGGRGRYVEISLPSMEKHTYHGVLPPFSSAATVSELALTDDGTASVSVFDPLTSQHWMIYTFDRTIAKWMPAQVEAGVSPVPSLVGSDAGQLVFTSGHWAGFLSMPH